MSRRNVGLDRVGVSFGLALALFAFAPIVKADTCVWCLTNGQCATCGEYFLNGSCTAICGDFLQPIGSTCSGPNVPCQLADLSCVYVKAVCCDDLGGTLGCPEGISSDDPIAKGHRQFVCDPQDPATWDQ